MDIECGLMVSITPRHFPFIWKNMMKFKTSNTICNHNAYQVEIINYNFKIMFKNINKCIV